MFPLEPIGFFLNRLSTWDPRLGAGTPKGLYPATLVWHGFQAAVAWLGLSPLNTQRVTYVVWFTALAAAMYGLVRAWQRIRGERLSCGVGLVAAAFYTLNPVMFNIWEAGKAGELSAALGLPLLLMVAALTFHGMCPVPLGVSLVGVIVVIVSEWGSPPVLGAVLLCFGSYVAAVWLHTVIRRDLQRLRRQMLFIGAATFVALISSLYWWLPLMAEVFGLMRVAEGGAGARTKIEALHIGSVGFSNWLEGISTHTSLLNVMRLQGIWDWYYSWGELPYVSYAHHFFRNPLLLLLGISLPIGAYLAVLFRRDFHTLWCAAAAVVFTILACGTHLPTGVVYHWLSLHVPGFTMFRSPFYKFGLVLALLYACLLATTTAELARRWQGTRRGARWVSGTALVGIALYGFPMFTGAIIPHREGTSLSSIKLRIPDYVYDAAHWLAHDAKPGRVILLPEQGADSYRWGFSSQLPLLNYLVDRSILHLIPQGYPIYLQRGNQVLLHLFTHAVEQRSTTRAATIARRLGVRYILVCRDGTTDTTGRQDPGPWFEARLKLQEGISLRRVFGQWAFYEVDEEPIPLVYAVTEAQILTGEIEGMVPLAAMEELPHASAFLAAKEMPPTTLDRFPVSRVVWYNAQVGDTMLEGIPGLVEQEFRPDEEYTVTIPKAEEYLVGVFRPPEEPHWAPPKVLLDQQVLVAPPSTAWLPPSERWILYGSYYLSQGAHHLRIREHASLQPRGTLMVVPLAQAGRSAMAWLAQLSRPGRALMWFYTSTAMDQEAGLTDIPGVRVSVPDSMGEVLINPWDQEEWAVTAGSSSYLMVDNLSPAPQWVDVALRIRSLGMTKDLTINVQPPGRDVLIHPVPRVGSQVRPITLGPLWLPPGRTAVELYTPFMQTTYPHFVGHQYSRGTFEFQRLRVGRPVMRKTVFIPRPDSYRIAIHRFRLPDNPSQPEPVPYRLLVDQHEIPLTWVTKHRLESPHPLTLTQGHHTITVVPSTDQTFGIQLMTSAPVASTMALQSFRRVDATDYRVTDRLGQPHLLVFREAFDPNWVLTQFPNASHVTVDGYANGWWMIPTRGGPQEIGIRYRIQQIFLRAVPISAVTVAVCAVIIGIYGVVALRRRRAA